MNIQYIWSSQWLTKDQKIQKINTYIKAFGNDKFRREWYIYKETWETITLDEYDELSRQEKIKLTKMYTDKSVREVLDALQKKQWLVDIDAVWDDVYAWGIWWYETNIDDIQQEKLQLDSGWKRELCNLLWKKSFSYLSELFVSPQSRWQKISSQLLDRYIQETNTTWLPYILTRTTTNKPNPEAMFLNRWFKNVYRYPNDPLNRSLFLKILTWQKWYLEVEKILDQEPL